MAASASGAILSALKFTESEAAFRPWWDNIEDYTVYIILILVRQDIILKIVILMNIFTTSGCASVSNFSSHWPASGVFTVSK